jgi:hypothetical protein
MANTFNASIGSLVGTGDVTIDTNVFKVDTSANRVGIGTASPASVAEIAGLLTISGLSSGTTAISLNDTKIAGLSDPTAAQDAATKAYVDAVASGLHVHTAVRLATVAALPANTAAGSGVGKTLTADANGALSVDGVAVAVGNRVLVKNESTGANNGIYTVTATGDGSNPFVLTRATDFDGSPSSEVMDGSFAFVGEGTLASTGWVQTANAPITVDTTALVFAQFNASVSYLGGAGLVLTGNTFDVVAHADGSIVVNANDIQVGVLATDAQHGNRGGGALHADATTSVAGFMSAADKTKIDAVSGTNTGDVTLGAIGSTPNANGATLTGQLLNLEPASASFGGIVTTGTQTIAGAKTFSGDLTASSGNITASGGAAAITTGYSFVIGTQKLLNGSAAPVSGTWATGDIVYNTAPAAGGNIGWVCVAGGSPGTWKEFGLISL